MQTRTTITRDVWGGPVEELVPAHTFRLVCEALRFYATENHYTPNGVMMNGYAADAKPGRDEDRGKFARAILQHPGVEAAL